MGGKHYALLRLVRLIPALRSTVTLQAFTDLNAFKSIASLILCAELWKYLFSMARSLYPALRVLRLSDMKSPVMDKLLFFARQMDRFLPKYLAEAEAIGKKFRTEEVIKKS